MSASPIKDVLSTLHRHSDVVESSLAGVVAFDGSVGSTAVLALRNASALRPAGDDGYRLHPRFREYLQDHLQTFPAFQSLAEIGSRITNIYALWTEIELRRGDNDYEMVNGLISSMQMLVFDILDSMSRNMNLLHTLLSTRFGNVKSLSAKKAQNRFYQHQSSVLSADVVRLAKVSDTIEREASARRLDEVAMFLRKNLIGKIGVWQQGLSEIQTQIRQEIFRTREVELDEKYLARMDMLLRQQPGWRGPDLEFDGDIPDFLLATRMPAFSPNIDVGDMDGAIQSEMAAVASSLPEKAVVPNKEPPRKFTRIVKAQTATAPTPGLSALLKLIKSVKASNEGVGLCEWRKGDVDASTMESHVWLGFAVMALRSEGLKVSLILDAARDGEKFTHTFRDAIAYSNQLVLSPASTA